MNWNEKYRPQTLDDIKGQDHVVSRMKAQIKEIHNSTDGDLPHLMFIGPAGSGKDCAVKCFLVDCFGESWTDNLTPLNASDKRKIDDMRTKVRDSAKRTVVSTYRTSDGRVKDLPFNIIFMNEADALTPEAQGALRSMMEEYAHITRFIFCLNYDYKIIDPIKSRCSIFRFRRIKPVDMIDILMPIIMNENITIKDDALNELCIAANGDARRGQNLLYNAWLERKPITIEMINEVSGKLVEGLNTDLIVKAINANQSDDETWQKVYTEMWNYLEDLYYDYGMSAKEVIYKVIAGIKEDSEMPIVMKRRLLFGAGDTLYRCSLDDNIVHILSWLMGMK